MPDFPLHTTRIDPTDSLPAETPMARALSRLAEWPTGVIPISGREVQAVTAAQLRIAAQHGLDGAVGDFAEPDLVVADEAAARALLDERPALPGVVVSGDGSPTLVAREVPKITTAIVMAGGLGSRLRPLTDDTPKPLLEVGGRILLYRILDRLQDHGVTRLFVSIHYLGEKVRAAVGDGSQWGMDVTYLEEDRPLDTGAGLALLKDVTDPFFVINGDILTTLDLQALGRWHQLEGSLATIATYRYAAPLPYGVVHRDHTRVVDIEEKPVYRYDINSGIYAFAPDALDSVEYGEPLAMVDFLNRHASQGDRIRGFPIVEYWNDVGTHADFERAQQEVHEL